MVWGVGEEKTRYGVVEEVELHAKLGVDWLA